MIAYPTVLFCFSCILSPLFITFYLFYCIIISVMMSMGLISYSSVGARVKSFREYIFESSYITEWSHCHSKDVVSAFFKKSYYLGQNYQHSFFLILFVPSSKWTTNCKLDIPVEKAMWTIFYKALENVNVLNQSGMRRFHPGKTDIFRLAWKKVWNWWP